MSGTPFDGMTQLPDRVVVGQIGGGKYYSTVEADEGMGLCLFLTPEDHAKSELPVELKGEDPVWITRERVLELCSVAYLIDTLTDSYASFLIRDTSQERRP